MLTIISVAFGNTDDILEQLYTLDVGSMNGRIEFIVNDNNYAPCSLERYNSKNIQYVYRHTGNIGFASAVNNCINKSSANSTHILLLNPDCLIKLEDIEQVLETSINAPNLIFSPLLVDEKGKYIENFKEKWNLVSVLWYRTVPYRFAVSHFRSSFEPLKAAGKNLEWLLGAFIVVPKSYFLKYGNLDPNYFLCADDMADLLLRNDGDYKIQIISNMEVCHTGGGSSKYVRKSALAWAYYGHVYFFRKNKSKLQYYIAKNILSLFLAVRILASIFTRNPNKNAYMAAISGIKLEHENLVKMTRKEFK